MDVAEKMKRESGDYIEKAFRALDKASDAAFADPDVRDAYEFLVLARVYRGNE